MNALIRGLAGERPSSLPKPSPRNGACRCAIQPATRQSPLLKPLTWANLTNEVSLSLDKTWRQRQTHPVPWAQFFGVDTDIEKAAQQSRTISYQRERIARYVKEEKGQITAHIVLNDLHPDRASPETAETLARHLAKAPHNVVFLYVNFSQANGWRKHTYLEQALEGYSSLALDPVEMIIEGQIFNPVDHFRSWQQRSEMHSQGKLAHAEQVLTYLSANPAKSWSAWANSLNQTGLTTHGGKSWTADNLRKFVNVMGEDKLFGA